MNSPTVHNPAYEKRIANVFSVYTVENPPQTNRYLAENVNLLDTLDAIPPKLREFGLAGELRLELDEYPDSHDDKRLIVSVYSNAAPAAIADSLHAFDEGWWLDQLVHVGARVCIVLRFQ